MRTVTLTMLLMLAALTAPAQDSGLLPGLAVQKAPLYRSLAAVMEPETPSLRLLDEVRKWTSEKSRDLVKAGMSGEMDALKELLSLTTDVSNILRQSQASWEANEILRALPQVRWIRQALEECRQLSLRQVDALKEPGWSEDTNLLAEERRRLEAVLVWLDDVEDAVRDSPDRRHGSRTVANLVQEARRWVLGLTAFNLLLETRALLENARRLEENVTILGFMHDQLASDTGKQAHRCASDRFLQLTERIRNQIGDQVFLSPLTYRPFANAMKRHIQAIPEECGVPDGKRRGD